MERGKRKKNSKGGVIVLLVLLLIAGVGACYWYLPQAQAADENYETVLEEGQEYTYAKITSILGNEIEYVIVEAKTADFDNAQRQDGRKGVRGGSENVSGKNRSAAAQGKDIPLKSEMQNMDSVPFVDGMPEMGSVSSEVGMSEMGNMSHIGEMPTGNNTKESDRSGAQKSSVRNGADKTQDAFITMYTETDRTGLVQIPVGTEVETKLGTVTTFSRLSSGDIVKMLLQADDAGNKTLMKIWIVE